MAASGSPAPLTLWFGNDQVEVEAAIRERLAGGDPRAALNIPLRALQAVAGDVRRARPQDAPLIFSELAATILVTAEQMPAYQPWRWPGCPLIPGTADLIRSFSAALAHVRNPEGQP